MITAATDTLTFSASKAQRYSALASEIAAVVRGEVDVVAHMATVAAMLAHCFEAFAWTGFYRVDPISPSELVIGPYQGALGCLRIAIGRGVCGEAAARRETVIVPDVQAFAGHIACDPRTRSEIVAPVFDRDGKLIAVCDVDSFAPAAFDQIDAEGLERILADTFGAQPTLQV